MKQAHKRQFHFPAERLFGFIQRLLLDRIQPDYSLSDIKWTTLVHKMSKIVKILIQQVNRDDK
jgi:hypothetical protein